MSLPRRSQDTSIPFQEVEEEKNVQTGASTSDPTAKEEKRVSLEVALPEIPSVGLDLNFGTSMDPSTAAEAEKVQKRASNVMKLAQENEKLKAELRDMTERLEAAERRREQLARKQQQIMEEPSS
ncbi:hypothetical protein GALMADRAFT_221414 [Galerina marginata CBS 339.88]|uniref:Uncharacterized protein n=1 Tax=Galerina marginata (strain CBS 339.88) TaxID=685588 RepID=A0A067TEI7_GALM3|nr:hypothetical protein GALMADRAFT_221414 [Galerina marginata CBS 339.88]